MIWVLAYLTVGFAIAVCAVRVAGVPNDSDRGFLIFPLLSWPLCALLGVMWGLCMAALYVAKKLGAK